MTIFLEKPLALPGSANKACLQTFQYFCKHILNLCTKASQTFRPDYPKHMNWAIQNIWNAITKSQTSPQEKYTKKGHRFFFIIIIFQANF